MVSVIFSIHTSSGYSEGKRKGNSFFSGSRLSEVALAKRSSKRVSSTSTGILAISLSLSSSFPQENISSRKQKKVSLFSIERIKKGLTQPALLKLMSKPYFC